MACTYNLSDFISGVVVPSSGSAIYTYNGFVSSYDGDKDNLGQFIDVPSSPPEEFPAVSGTTADISFDATTHDSGYYSFTLTVSGGGCSPQSVNFVIPIVEAFDVGSNKTISRTINDSAFVLYDAWSNAAEGSPLADNAPSDANVSGIGWANTAQIASYAGYIPVGSALDITDDMFDPSLVSVGTYIFNYRIAPNDPSGFNNDNGCDNCEKASTLTLLVKHQCTDTDLCYNTSVSGIVSIHAIVLSNGSSLNNSTASDYFTFPYQVALGTDAARLETDLIAYYNDNGGYNSIEVNQVSELEIEIIMDGPCIGHLLYCLDGGCSSTVTANYTFC